jgi:hypothetical protein
MTASPAAGIAVKARAFSFVGLTCLLLGLYLGALVWPEPLASGTGLLILVIVWWAVVLALVTGGFLVIRHRRDPIWCAWADEWRGRHPLAVQVFAGLLIDIWIFLAVEAGVGGWNWHAAKQTVYDGKNAADFNIPDENLGYRIKPNLEIRIRRRNSGKTIFEAVYHTDAFGRRVVPNATDGEVGGHPSLLSTLASGGERERVSGAPPLVAAGAPQSVTVVGSASQAARAESGKKFALFFGCSMTFGTGINDDQTLPCSFSRFAPAFKSYNYAVPGYGPQNMLVQLGKPELATEIPEKSGVGFFLFFNNHVERAIGAMYVCNAWAKNLPWFFLDDQQKLQRSGNFLQGRSLLTGLYRILGRSPLVAFSGVDVPLWFSDAHFRLLTAMFREAKERFRRQFGSDQFFVVFYPGASLVQELGPRLKAAGVGFIDLSGILDITAPGNMIEGDGHPTPRVQEALGKVLAGLFAPMASAGK